MSLLEVKGIRKSFGNHTVLDGIDLSVQPGDVTAILGPSGSGKTTLLRCLNFLEKADGGTLSFDGDEYELGHMKRKDIAAIRKKTAFVFQSYELFSNMSALENVMLGLTVGRGISKEEARKTGLEMLDKVGLSALADKYPIQLSGGQQQRVAIARAIAMKPEIIYFDEPASALDPELIGEVLTVIKNLAAEGMTMLVVTHELNFARNVSNKVIFMEGGHILEENSSKEFFANPKEERTKEFLKNISTQHDV